MSDAPPAAAQPTDPADGPAVVPAAWASLDLPPGGEAEHTIVVSERYSGASIRTPMHLIRGKADGPTVCVTAAVHGDEINGTGTIRHLIRERPFELERGTLVLVPVVNMPGFERHTRYLPDRRDLNRCFPGRADGSLASRLAHSFFSQVIRHCDWGIDLHTASVRRTNFPNVRADMGRAGLAELARAFGAELICSGRGPRGSLRRSATRAGCPTLILEAGEVWKVERSVVEFAVAGITNCLKHLGMVAGEPEKPAYQVEIDVTKWVRADDGGFLEFHVGPGDTVSAGDVVATSTSLTGAQQSTLVAAENGIVLGMTTMPSVAPGDPVYHLAYPKKGTVRRVEKAVDAMEAGSLHERLRDDLASSVHVTDSEG